MGTRLPLCIVGGIFLYWIFGFFFTRRVEEDEFGYTYYYPYTNYAPDMLGIICMIIIIGGAILTFVLGTATENKAAVVGGILGICVMIFFLILFFKFYFFEF